PAVPYLFFVNERCNSIIYEYVILNQLSDSKSDDSDSFQGQLANVMAFATNSGERTPVTMNGQQHLIPVRGLPGAMLLNQSLGADEVTSASKRGSFRTGSNIGSSRRNVGVRGARPAISP